MNNKELRKLLNERNLPALHLAKTLGVSESTVHRWLSGQTEISRVVELAIQKVLGI